MTNNAAAPHAFSMISSFQPMTFRERGAAVPFTTPVLSGTRIRLGPREQPEVLVCNPAGGKGVYVVNLTGIEAFCQPSLFDRALIVEICASCVLTPAGLRQAALRTMAGGLAGRAAQRRATQAPQHAEALQHQARIGLQQLLDSQISASGTRASLAILASRLNLPAELIGRITQALADLCAEIGILISVKSPLAERLARLTKLSALADAAMPWLDGRRARDIELMRTDLQQYLSCGKRLDADIAGLLGSAPTLIADFARDPILVAERLTQVDWLFDGWDRILTFWQDGATAGPLPAPAVLAAILPQTPPLPSEALAMIGVRPPSPAQTAPTEHVRPSADEHRSVVSLNELLARNESALAA